jgi:hypothetical protein
LELPVKGSVTISLFFAASGDARGLAVDRRFCGLSPFHSGKAFESVALRHKEFWSSGFGRLP